MSTSPWGAAEGASPRRAVLGGLGGDGEPRAPPRGAPAPQPWNLLALPQTAVCRLCPAPLTAPASGCRVRGAPGSVATARACSDVALSGLCLRGGLCGEQGLLAGCPRARTNVPAPPAPLLPGPHGRGLAGLVWRPWARRPELPWSHCASSPFSDRTGSSSGITALEPPLAWTWGQRELLWCPNGAPPQPVAGSKENTRPASWLGG